MPYKYLDQWHVKMRDLQRRLIQKHASDSTIKSYNAALTKCWNLLGKPKSPLDVSLEEYQALEQRMIEDGLAENSIVLYTTKLKIFLRFVKYPNVNEIYVESKLHAKEDRVFLEPDQQSRARELAHNFGLKYELAFSLAVDNSLRRGDLANITLEEAVQMAQTGQGYITQKGNRRRPIVLHKNTMEPLTKYLDERDQAVTKLSSTGISPEPYLFINFRTGKHISPGTVHTWMMKISNASGFYFRAHDLRATCVRRHARAGTPPEIVMMITGHKNFGTTFTHYYGKDTYSMRNAQDRI